MPKMDRPSSQKNELSNQPRETRMGDLGSQTREKQNQSDWLLVEGKPGKSEGSSKLRCCHFGCLLWHSVHTLLLMWLPETSNLT
jgi:hypothetical protein